MPEINLPPLAHYRSLHDYQPRYGDYVIWSGWFAAWHGLVVAPKVVKSDIESVQIIFAGLPYLLVTMSEEEHEKNTKTIPLHRIKDAVKGSWAILRYEKEHGINVWFI